MASIYAGEERDFVVRYIAWATRQDPAVSQIAIFSAIHQLVSFTFDFYLQ